MLKIRPATDEDLHLLCDVARRSFLQSHGSSAAAEDLETYVKEKFTPAQLRAELTDAKALFRLAFYGENCAGYAKLLLSSECPFSEISPLCKMDRLYVLEEYLDKKIGKALFDACVKLAKEKDQKGLWLYVWTGNKRALRFYEREGFRKIGEAGFRISPKHSNPNYILLLEF